MDDAVIKLKKAFSFLSMSKIDEIKFRIIIQSLDEEDIEKGSIYNLISEKTNLDNTTIQKFVAKIINNTNQENLLKEMEIDHKPKSKELLIHIYKKIKCFEELNNEYN